MNIYELRKSTSRNKKHKYIYELIIDDQIVATRRTSKEYAGVWLEETKLNTRYHWFQVAGFAPFLAKLSTEEIAGLALTFDELLKFKNLST